MRRAPSPPDRPCPPRVRVAALACLLLAGVPLATVRATCMPPLAPGLVDPGALAEDQPREVVRLLRAQIDDGPQAPDVLSAAERHAVLASALVQASEPAAALEAAAEGLALLDRVPPSPSRRYVLHELQLAQSDANGEAGRFAESVKVLDALIGDSVPDSVDHVCALIVRSQNETVLGALGKATQDAVEAHETSRRHGWSIAQEDSALALAELYSSAGLYEQAGDVISELVAGFRDGKYLVLQESAQFSIARTRIAQGRYADAQEAIARTIEIARRIGDTVGMGAAEINACDVDLGLSRLAEAREACARAESLLHGSDRRDLLGELDFQKARVANLSGDPATALRLLDPLIAAKVSVHLHATRLNERAKARAGVGDYRGAFDDERAATELTRRRSEEEHRRAVSVIGAVSHVAELKAQNEVLAANLTSEERESALQRRLRNVSISLSLAILAVAILLAFVLYRVIRQGRALRRQSAIVRTSLHYAPDALALFDERRRISFENRPLFGSAGGPEPASSTGAAPAEPDDPVFRRALDTVFRDRQPARAHVVVSGTDGQTREFDVQAAPVIEGERFLGAVVRSMDVTELRQLERALVDATRTEQLRLGSELHEGLGQQLTGISMLLQGVVSSLERGAPVQRADLEAIKKYVQAGIETVRLIARGLAPIGVVQGSLADALRSLAHETQQYSGIEVTVDVGDLPTMTDERADHLYRIAREAVVNAARHSGAQSVRIALRREDPGVVLTVDDDGSGIDASASQGGFGLPMIAYRARMLGGESRILARAEGGTRVRVELPN